MKILLISLNFSPELTGIGKYSGEMANGLVDRGHEVAVVCAPPYYPQWRVLPGHSAWSYRTERPRPGLTIHRCPVWVPSSPGGLARILHLASFAVSSLPLLLLLVAWQPRVVLAVAPALLCAPGAWLVARLTAAKAWLHVQDFEVDAAFALGLLRRPLLRTAALQIERWLLRRFDMVSTISQGMLRGLIAKGVPPRQRSLLPNWADLSQIRPGRSSPALRRRMGIADGQIVCLFSGTLNRKQGAHVLIETARLLGDDPRVVFVICGNGEMVPALRAQAADLANVRFHDLLPAEQLNELLNMADIHLLPQLRGAADLVMPSKLVGMLASGRPVVAGADEGTEIARVVADCGRVVEPENPYALAKAVVQLAADDVLRLELGAVARAAAERTLDARAILDGLHARLVQLEQDAPELPVPLRPIEAGVVVAGAEQRE